VTPLVPAREAQEMGFKIAIWPCFAMTAAYLAYRKVAKELVETGAVAERTAHDERRWWVGYGRSLTCVG